MTAETTPAQPALPDLPLVIVSAECPAWNERQMRDYALEAIAEDRMNRETAAEAVCAEAYQVIGSLLSDLGQFDKFDGSEKILDNLSQARRVHEDVLPWPSFSTPSAPEAAPVAAGWRPIETAPKDGTHILLANQSGVSEGGWLSDVDHGAEWEGQVGMAGWWRTDGADWPNIYWMPLPAAPQPDAAGKEDEAKPGLADATADLVQRFAQALAEKLSAAEKKYGYSDGWLSVHWEDACRIKFMEHIKKGDPRDVAAYCAFMWHHGWSTSDPKKTGVIESCHNCDDGLRIGPVCETCGHTHETSGGVTPADQCDEEDGFAIPGLAEMHSPRFPHCEPVSSTEGAPAPASQASGGPATRDEREAFEAWVVTQLDDDPRAEFDKERALSHYTSGGYAATPTAASWHAWQARAALSTPSAGDGAPTKEWLASKLAACDEPGGVMAADPAMFPQAPARTMTPFDAIERALELSSLHAGSVGMNDRAGAEAYRGQLRAHLMTYIYPSENEAAAPQPPALPAGDSQNQPMGTAPDLHFSWMDFQRISDLPAVNEAICNLEADQTEDNATCLIRAVIEAARDRLAALAAQPQAAPQVQAAAAVVGLTQRQWTEIVGNACVIDDKGAAIAQAVKATEAAMSLNLSKPPAPDSQPQAATLTEPAIVVTIDEHDAVQGWAESRLPPGTHKLYTAPHPHGLADDRRDAERYRVWRADYANQADEEMSNMMIALADSWTPDQVDAAIDAAMAASSGGKP